ncbi:MAG: hypothetical protein GY911_09595 [Actinomycetales bacterium]|nr:hypothetical protein [Actinomycetales bacterium]
MTETPSSITCQRCGTRTTWTPYCPGCGAYLEFAGVPPWTPPKPDPPTGDGNSTDSADSPESADSPTETPAHDDESAPEHSPEPSAGTSQSLSAPTHEGAQDTGHATDDQGPPTAGSDGTDEGGTDGGTEADEPPPPKVRRGDPDPWWKLWARPIIEEPTDPATSETPAVGHEHASMHDEESTGVVVPQDVPAEIQSEEPAKALQATERTIAVGQGGGLGPLDGTPCSRCGFRNEPTAHFCARCGLNFAVVARTTTSTQQAPEDSVTAERPPQRRDWALIGFIALLIAVLLFVLLAPQPNPIFTAFTNGFRAVTYWIAPTAGRSAPYDAIQASSTGFGSPASSLAGNTTATYWASDISPNFGAGTTLTFRLVDNYTLDRMLIQPGIQNGVLDVRALATPKQIRLTFFKAFVQDQDPTTEEVPVSNQKTDISGAQDIGPSACPDRLQPIATTSSASPSADPSASSTVSPSGSSSANPATSPSNGTSPSPTVSPTPSPTPSPTSSPTTSPSAAQATKSPSISPSTSPGAASPTGRPSTTVAKVGNCTYVEQGTQLFDLPLIMNLQDYTTVVQFPKVDAARIQLDIVSTYRPRFSDPYAPTSTRGQVAVTNVLLYPQFTLSDLLDTAWNVQYSPESPSPSPSASPTGSESASARPTSSPTASATNSPSATPSN